MNPLDSYRSTYEGQFGNENAIFNELLDNEVPAPDTSAINDRFQSWFRRITDAVLGPERGVVPDPTTGTLIQQQRTAQERWAQLKPIFYVVVVLFAGWLAWRVVKKSA